MPSRQPRRFALLGCCMILLSSGLYQTHFLHAQDEAKAKKEDEDPKVAEEKAKARRKEQASKITFKLVAPEEVTLDSANSTKFRLKLQITNNNTAPVLIAPFFSVKIQSPDGEVLEPETKKARWRRTLTTKNKRKESDNSIDQFDDLTWIDVNDSATRTIGTNLVDYQLDFNTLYTYKFPAPGKYKITMTYNFNKEEFIKRAKAMGSTLDFEDSAKMWNHALEFKQEASTTLVIK